MSEFVSTILFLVIAVAFFFFGACLFGIDNSEETDE